MAQIDKVSTFDNYSPEYTKTGTKWQNIYSRYSQLFDSQLAGKQGVSGEKSPDSQSLTHIFDFAK